MKNRKEMVMKFDRSKKLRKCDSFPSVLIFFPDLWDLMFGGRQVWIASLFDNFMHVFNVLTQNIYNLLGGYISDCQCVPHQKTFQAIYTLYRLRSQIKAG